MHSEPGSPTSEFSDTTETLKWTYEELVRIEAHWTDQIQNQQRRIAAVLAVNGFLLAFLATGGLQFYGAVQAGWFRIPLDICLILLTVGLIFGVLALLPRIQLARAARPTPQQEEETQQQEEEDDTQWQEEESSSGVRILGPEGAGEPGRGLLPQRDPTVRILEPARGPERLMGVGPDPLPKEASTDVVPPLENDAVKERASTRVTAALRAWFHDAFGPEGTDPISQPPSLENSWLDAAYVWESIKSVVGPAALDGMNGVLYKLCESAALNQNGNRRLMATNARRRALMDADIVFVMVALVFLIVAIFGRLTS